jgi:hypothetical protein
VGKEKAEEFIGKGGFGGEKITFLQIFLNQRNQRNRRVGGCGVGR